MGKLKTNIIQNSPRMPYMQYLCPNSNRKKVQLGSKVEFTGQKYAIFVFLKNSLNKRAVTLILELDGAIAYTLVKFEYWSTSTRN